MSAARFFGGKVVRAAFVRRPVWKFERLVADVAAELFAVALASKQEQKQAAAQKKQQAKQKEQAKQPPGGESSGGDASGGESGGKSGGESSDDDSAVPGWRHGNLLGKQELAEFDCSPGYDVKECVQVGHP